MNFNVTAKVCAHHKPSFRQPQTAAQCVSCKFTEKKVTETRLVV